MPLKLKPVSVLDTEAEWELLQSLPSENGFENDAYGIRYEEFSNWLLRRVKEANGIDLREGYVPQQMYWLMLCEEGKPDRPIGLGKLRLSLTEWLLNHSGNIGYGIAPEFRGKGYAKQFVALLLARAKAKGLDMVLLTVNADNPASYKAIEKNGGILQKEAEGTRWYWVYL